MKTTVLATLAFAAFCLGHFASATPSATGDGFLVERGSDLVLPVDHMKRSPPTAPAQH